MLGLLENRAVYWIPRLHFALILLIFGELIAWQQAAQYQPLDWAALLAIYLAVSAVLLDVMARFQVNDWRTILIAAGLFGLLHGTLISLAAADVDQIVRGLLFRVLGMETLMFLLAFAGFRLLSSGEATGLWEFLLAGALGLIWGLWVRWFPQLKGIELEELSLTGTLPFVIGLLASAALLPYLFRISIVQMTLQDWTLTPYEWTATGGVLLVAFLIRSEFLSPFALAIVATLFIMLVMMLMLTSRSRRGSLLQTITPPRLPLILGWLILLIPFALMGVLGYSLFDGNATPFVARVLFSAITVFGALWVPLASIWLGTSLMIQYTREGL